MQRFMLKSKIHRATVTDADLHYEGSITIDEKLLEEANMALYLAGAAAFEAADRAVQTHGGFGFANEYDVERKFRETRLYQVAPISTNLIYSYIAEHILGLPRSF